MKLQVTFFVECIQIASFLQTLSGRTLGSFQLGANQQGVFDSVIDHGSTEIDKACDLPLDERWQLAPAYTSFQTTANASSSFLKKIESSEIQIVFP